MAKREANVLVTLRDRASSGLRRLGGVANKLAKSFGLVTAAATAITAVIGVRFLSGAIRSAGEFDEAMSTIGAVTQATAQEMEGLREAADLAGATTRFTATEAANGLEELARSGQNASQAIDTLNPVLQLAAGNNQTVAESAIQVTTALNAFGLASDQAARVSDVYTRAAQRSAQTTGQLGEAMTFVAPVARQAGLEIEETAALIGKLADAGFRGSLGGTALRNAILQFQDPASQFRAELEALGIRTDDFVGALEGLAESGDGAEAAIRSLGLRAGPAIQAIVAQGGPALRELTQELRNAEGASKGAADALEDNLPGALRGFASAFDSARRRLVAPLVDSITDQIQDLTERLRNFTSSGILDRFAELLKEAFETGTQAVRNFISNVDFQAVEERLLAFVDSSKRRLAEFAENMGGLERAFESIVGTVQFSVGLVRTAFNGLGTVIAGVLTLSGRIIEAWLGLLDRMTFGAIGAVGKIRDELSLINDSIEDSTRRFAENTASSFGQVVDGYNKMAGTAEDSAARQSQANREAAESQREAAKATRDAAKAQEEARASLERSIAAVKSWDRAADEAEGTTRQTAQTVADLGDSAEQTGTDIAAAADKAEEASEKQQEAAQSALTAWLDFGDGIEAVSLQVEELAGTAQSLDQLRAQAEAARPPIDRLREAIAAASSTEQLDLVVQTMARLREEGSLTEQQYRELTEAVLDQAEALRESTRASDDQADSFRRVSREAVDAAAGFDAVNRASRGASEQAKRTAGGFGAILDQWRELGPDANRQVDLFIEGVNAFPQLSFSVFRTKLARFTQFMEDKFGAQRDAAREARDEVDEFERSASRGGTISDGQVRLTKDVNITIEVKRDPQGPVSLSEAQINTIVSRVVSVIEGDQERTG